jgi:hypothetical protein
VVASSIAIWVPAKIGFYWWFCGRRALLFGGFEGNATQAAEQRVRLRNIAPHQRNPSF